MDKTLGTWIKWGHNIIYLPHLGNYPDITHLLQVILSSIFCIMGGRAALSSPLHIFNIVPTPLLKSHLSFVIQKLRMWRKGIDPMLYQILGVQPHSPPSFRGCLLQIHLWFWFTREPDPLLNEYLCWSPVIRRHQQFIWLPSPTHRYLDSHIINKTFLNTGQNLHSPQNMLFHCG